MLNASVFHLVFDHFDHPVLLKGEEGWLTNPAAQALCLPQGDLDMLAAWEADASLWLARQFYHVSPARVDGQLLLMLQPDTFLASAAENLASQLRTRLGSAFGSTTALGQSAALRSDLKAREELSTVNRELYRLFRMVLQLEQCSGDDVPVRMVCVDLVERFSKLSGELEELCKAANVRFTAETDLVALPALADGRQLDQLLLNLVDNALKNVPAQGGHITLSLKCQQQQAVFTVSDNAGGFSPDFLAHPLWSDPHRLLPRRGLGLGLLLAQRVAAAHEGTVMVFPSPKGSRVVFSMPVRTAEDLFCCPELPIDFAPGFSLAKIMLSDSLPPSLYFPQPYGDEE